MRQTAPNVKLQFEHYVRAAAESPESLAFLAENLGDEIVMDYTVESLAKCERLYWHCVEYGIPGELINLDEFAQLLCQYFGECARHQAAAKWVMTQPTNAMYPQPCIDGFGGQEWDREYPVDTALHLRDLPRTKPTFPGMFEKRVLATKLETIIRIHQQSERSHGSE